MRIGRSELTDQVTLLHKHGNGAYGTIYSSATLVPCIMELAYQKVVDREGNEVVASAMLMVLPTCYIVIGDKVVYEGQSYEVIGVQPARDHHKEVYLTSTGVAI